MVGKAAAHREPKLNQKLCHMLKGVDAQWEAEHQGNKSIDIEVTLQGNLQVAVECEKYGQNKRAEAVKDAASRLAPIRMVDVALAVVYPKGCDTLSDLTQDTILDYAMVTADAARRYRNDHKRHAKRCTWLKTRAADLAEAIRNLPRSLGDPDQLAADLRNRLYEGADSLTAQQRRSLARAISLESGDEKSAARRALLIVASAALFHARVDDYLRDMKPPDYDGEWPPMQLGACIRQPNTVTALQAAWETILIVDYKRIFEAALNVLGATASSAFTRVVQDLAEWAIEAAGRIGGLRHDLLGRIFHAMLDTAKNDGSYYTSVPAAILLAGLMMRSRDDIPDDMRNMRIIDPACGTGTLLMAAAERTEKVLGDEYDAAAMIESVLWGTDINVTALHMAATTLALLSPTTKFSRMGIGKAPFGPQVEPNRGDENGLAGLVAAGSLELCDENGLDPYFGWAGRGIDNIESGERRRSRTYKHAFDYVIMNPPFTRHDLRHKQLGRDGKKLVILREKEIFRDFHIKPNKTSSGIMFLALGEHLVKPSTGALAFVFPLSGATAASTRTTRIFLAKRFHIDTIVVPHDPKRFWFSENTRISEMLVVVRRNEEQRNRGTEEQRNRGTEEQRNRGTEEQRRNGRTIPA